MLSLFPNLLVPTFNILLTYCGRQLFMLPTKRSCVSPVSLIHYNNSTHSMLPKSPTSSPHIRRRVLYDDPLFQRVFTSELTELWSLFDKHRFELRIAGGAVRDLLLGIEPKDVDLATVATPTQMESMFDAEQVRMFNRNGVSHGTVSVRMHDKANFEVTTLRIDTSTDGRHAEVQFTTDWELDAGRRDLTINSMFLDREGTLYDFFGGYEDTQERRVRFVGDASQRICEDYLRILRFFRFHGRVAKDDAMLDLDTLKAIREHVSGLAGISGERLWVELRLILVGRQTPMLMRHMCECGVHTFMGLPSDMGLRVAELERRWPLMTLLQPHHATVLATLLGTIHDVEVAHARMKFSNEELKIMTFIVEKRNQFETEEDLAPFQEDFLLHGQSKFLQEELIKYFGRKELLDAFRQWTPPRFPVNGRHLTSRGIRGPRVGLLLQKLRQMWVKMGTDTSLDDLMKCAEADGILSSDPAEKHNRSPSPARNSTTITQSR